ncbi:MAG: hypothetical protein KIT83_19050 [Bryobacterales bacterium]|nr:hypothetical protein [Bryobacterales bacterium]
MNRMSAAKFFIVILLLSLLSPTLSGDTQVMTDDEKKAFLRSAKLVDSRDVGEGVTHSQRITLSSNGLVHDAHLQIIDERKDVLRTSRAVQLYFRDSYKFNVAAYELSEMLGLDMVPVSVERKVGLNRGAVTWWVDDVAMSGRQRFEKKVDAPDPERWTRQVETVRVFDELIGNTDRHLGNLLITGDWQLWMVDHTRAFRRNRALRNPAILKRCDRQLLHALRNLDEASAVAMLDRYLDHRETLALLVRAKLIVEHFDARVAKYGETKVLFDLENRDRSRTDAQTSGIPRWAPEWIPGDERRLPLRSTGNQYQSR